MAKLVSQVYGEALFGLAVESGNLAELSQELEAVTGILDQNVEFAALLVHPQLSEEEKADAFDRVFADRISAQLTGFFHVLLEKGRMAEYSAIAAYFKGRQLEHDRIGVAEVTSAVELTDAQRAKIEKRLLETTDYLSMQMRFETDPALIGGLKIRIGDRVVDSSIQSRINELKAQLMEIRL